MERYRTIQIVSETRYTKNEIVEDQITGNRCFAKWVHKKSNAIYIHQFHREIDVLSNVHSLNIPKIYDVVERNEWLGIIEENIEGITLEEYITSHRFKASLNRFKWIRECICLIHEIHEIGYLYIDIKPSNFILSKKNLYLIDFNTCIPIGNKVAYFASNENKAPELSTTNKKTVQTDIYSIGSFIKKLYTNHFYRYTIKKCMKKEPEKRFKSLKGVQISLWIHWCFRLFIFIFLIISITVCLLFNIKNDTPLSIYLKSRDKKDLIRAYVYTLNLRDDKSYQERIQNNLYQWIENDWVSTEELRNETISNYFLTQAILSENPTYIEFFLKYVENGSITDILILAKNMLYQDYSMSRSQVHNILKDIFKNDLTFVQRQERLNCILILCLKDQIIMNKEDITSIENYVHSIDREELVNNWEINKDFGCNYLEYCMLLKTVNTEVTYPQLFIDVFNKEPEFKNLYEIWRLAK